jgi:hypothetical protein
VGSTTGIWNALEAKDVSSCEGVARIAGSDNMLAKDIGSFALTGFCFGDVSQADVVVGMFNFLTSCEDGLTVCAMTGVSVKMAMFNL